MIAEYYNWKRSTKGSSNEDRFRTPDPRDGPHPKAGKKLGDRNGDESVSQEVSVSLNSDEPIEFRSESNSESE